METNKNPHDAEAARAFRAWLQDMHSPAHSRRTAEVNAGFFLPHLRPGMRLLDAGCGPGSITLGLGRAVAPGEVIGIDTSVVVIDRARSAARDTNQPNVTFEVADVRQLPFDDGSFDAVFAHAVLQHVLDATAALAELRRVLRPGGIIGVADADFGGSVLWPAPPAMRRALSLMNRVRRASGGDMFVGRKLGRCLAEAGFLAISSGATATADGTAEACARTGEFWAGYYSAPEMFAHAAAAGVAAVSELEAAAGAWRRWGQTPGAYWARFWCFAVATNPG